MEALITKQKGFSIIEVLLAVTVFSIFSVGIFYLSLDTIERDSKIELDNMALTYAQEGLEAVRNMRDRNFFLLTNGDHGLKLENSVWSFIAAPENIDNFYERTVVIYDVYRDAGGNIAEQGVFDPDTKKVVSTVAWNWKSVFPRSVSLTTYVTNWAGRDWIQTDCPEFNAGTFSDTISTETAAPPSNNCAVKLDLVEEQSSFFASSDIGDHGSDIEINSDYAYIANKKSQTGLTIIDVTDRDNPVVIENVDIGAKGRFIKKNGSYAYISVENKTAGLAIVDISNPADAGLVSTLNVGDYGNKMDLIGNYLYMGTAASTDSLKIIDVSNKSAPSIAGSVNFDGVVRSVKIHNNYAFIGLENDIDSFRVLDISNPADPELIASLDLDEEVNDIEINGFYAFVGIESTTSSLKVVNISNPASPTLSSSLNAGGEIEDLTIYGDYLYAAIDEQNAGLAAINIDSPSSPYLIYNYDLTGKGTGIATDGQYIYITIQTNNRGMVITGTTSTGVVGGGEYISAPFDTGSDDTRYNYISWVYEEVTGSSLKFQLRTSDSIEGLESAIWVGSDGTENSYYENSRTTITTAPAADGVRYFQFKVIVESDGFSTPALETVKINYTP